MRRRWLASVALTALALLLGAWLSPTSASNIQRLLICADSTFATCGYVSTTGGSGVPVTVQNVSTTVTLSNTVTNGLTGIPVTASPIYGYQGPNWLAVNVDSSGRLAASVTTYSAATGSAAPAQAVYNGGISGAGITAEFQCELEATVNVTNSGNTQLVGSSGNKKVRVCGGFIIASSSSSVLTFNEGTGTNCASNLAALTGSMNLTNAGAGFVLPTSKIPYLTTGASRALCLGFQGASATTVAGRISYTLLE